MIYQASSTVESTAAVGYLHHLSEMNVTVQVPKMHSQWVESELARCMCAYPLQLRRSSVRS